jgi:hypothetical protein
MRERGDGAQFFVHGDASYARLRSVWHSFSRSRKDEMKAQVAFLAALAKVKRHIGFNTREGKETIYG